MPKLYLVRHGQARAAWSQDLDPGLNELGREQALQAARSLASLSSLDILSSPLARARETAQPLAEVWKKTPRLEARVGEIPSSHLNLSERGPWLLQVMAQKWPDLIPELQAWRAGVLQALAELQADTVIFTHFIAINAAVGTATQDDRVVSFWPGNGSITKLAQQGYKLTLIELGTQAQTRVG